MVGRQRVVVAANGDTFKGDCPAVDSEAVFVGDSTESETGADNILQFHFLVVKTDDGGVETRGFGCPWEDAGERRAYRLCSLVPIVEETPFAQLLDLLTLGVPYLQLKVGLALAAVVIEVGFECVYALRTGRLVVRLQGIVLHVEQRLQQYGTVARQAEAYSFKIGLAFLLVETETETVAFAKAQQVGDVELGHCARIAAESYQLVIYIEPIAR